MLTILTLYSNKIKSILEINILFHYICFHFTEEKNFISNAVWYFHLINDNYHNTLNMSMLTIKTIAVKLI